MKNLLLILLCLLGMRAGAQTVLKTDSSSVRIGTKWYPKNTIHAVQINDSTTAILDNSNAILVPDQKYSQYLNGDAGNAPFANKDSLNAWIRRSFFVDASASTVAAEASLYTGWAAYQDTVYTQAAPFHLLSGAKKTLPNRAQMTIETQKPIDVNMFYNKTDSTITGRTGDGLNVYVEFVAIPDASTTYLQSTIDIGGVVGELFNSVYTFPNGAGVPQRISYSFAGYTLDTWQANGAKVKVMSDGNCDIYGIRYVLTRTHKAR